MPATLFDIAYLAAGILFIMSLGGLAHQETARRGNVYGMIGMIIAIVATLFNDHIQSWNLIIGAVAIGGAIGVVLAVRVAMTAMPQLVAMLHSFVGLAAVAGGGNPHFLNFCVLWWLLL